jgi:hypothetical protein
LSPQLSRAGEWYLNSGIQQPNGGVSRYYRTDERRYMPVSTEITGYAASFLAYAHSLSGDARYLDAAIRAARFLTRTAWDPALHVMPFEIGPAAHTYFFDCGIIVRGLLSVWRVTRDEEFLAAAITIGNAMMRDFLSAEGDYHPILTLPDKRPEPRDPDRWSRIAACYQLKSAMAWYDLFESTGDNCFREPYQRVLEYSLQKDLGPYTRDNTMDRLHAYCYFLEGLLPWVHEKRCAEALSSGILLTQTFLRKFAPEFARSDVYAQLLRVRIFAGWAGAAPLIDRGEAAEEAAALATYQASDPDPRIDGGYWFGRKHGETMPFVNPVSTAFAAQALELWENRVQVTRHSLI